MGKVALWTLGFILAVTPALAATDSNPNCPGIYCKELPVVTPVPAMAVLGICDLWNDVPWDRWYKGCPVGQVAREVTYPSYPPLRQCPMVTFGLCVPAPVHGTATPTFQVLFVAYAPPGRGSSVTYASGTSVGSTVTLTDAWKNSTDIGLELGANVVIANGTLKVGMNVTQSGKQVNEEAVTVSNTEAFSVPGQSDVENHDWDQIWFMVKPVIEITVNPLVGPPYNLPSMVSWQYRDAQVPQLFYMFVGELTGTIPMAEDVASQLTEWGITPDTYPELLKADPFASQQTMVETMPDGTKVELLNWGGWDPTRFQLRARLPYRPLQPDEQPTKETSSLQQGQSSSASAEMSGEFSTSVEFSVGINALVASDKFTVGDKFTFTNTTSDKESTASTTNDSFTLSQPAYGYSGPVHVSVYEDLMWHTYAFRVSDE